MFQMTKEDALNTLKNYSMLMSRVKEVVNEIGFLDKEFDTLDINKTHFTKDSVHVVAYDGHYDLYDSVSCKFPLEFLFEPAEMLERPHPTDVGWGFYGLAPVKPR